MLDAAAAGMQYDNQPANKRSWRCTADQIPVGFYLGVAFQACCQQDQLVCEHLLHNRTALRDSRALRSGGPAKHSQAWHACISSFLRMWSLKPMAANLAAWRCRSWGPELWKVLSCLNMDLCH